MSLPLWSLPYFALFLLGRERERESYLLVCLFLAVLPHSFHAIIQAFPVFWCLSSLYPESLGQCLSHDKYLINDPSRWSIKYTFSRTENDTWKTQVTWVLRCEASSLILALVEPERKRKREDLGVPQSLWPNIFLFPYLIQCLKFSAFNILFLMALKILYQ